MQSFIAKPFMLQKWLKFKKYGYVPEKLLTPWNFAPTCPMLQSYMKKYLRVGGTTSFPKKTKISEGLKTGLYFIGKWSVELSAKIMWGC